MEHVHVLGIGGSLRKAGLTRHAVRIALEGASTAGASVESISLRDFDLPMCDGSKQYEDYPDVSRLSGIVKRSKGIVLGTPEYHGGYSGVLKNALDLMGFEEFGGKMVGLVGVSGGSVGATQALQGLRVVGRQLHCWVVPE